MLDTSRVAARLEAARAFADRIGLRVQLETRLAYLGWYAEPRRTLCTLFSDFEKHAFSFVMEAEIAGGGLAIWFKGRLTVHIPHDVQSPGAFPTFAVGVTPPLGWSIDPDPMRAARASRRHV